MKETEKVLRELEKLMKEKGDDVTQEDIDAFMQMYNDASDHKNFHYGEKTDEGKAVDLMYEIYDMDDEKEIRKQLKQVLKYDPSNIDALLMRMDLEDLDNEEELPKIIAIGKQRLHEKGLDQESSIGDYYGIIETRPYMRAMYQYFQLLKASGKYTLALEQGKEILRLNESDNMGVRYGLMGIYSVLERYEDAVALLDEFSEEYSSLLYIPLIVLCLKLNKTKEAVSYYKELQKVNKDCAKVFKKSGVDGKKMEHYANEGMYAPYSEGELYLSLYENIDTMIMNMEYYLSFFYHNLTKKKKPAKKNLS